MFQNTWKYLRGTLVCASLACFSSVVFATDYYVGVKGATVTVDQKENHFEVTFNTGTQSIKAEGDAKGSMLVLDHYQGGAAKDPGTEQSEPGIAMNFVGSLIHVSVSRGSPWYDSNIKGGYQKLDWQTVVPGISSENPQFAEQVKKMDETFDRLLQKEPEKSRQSLKEIQEKWCTDTSPYVQAYVLHDNAVADLHLSEKIEHAYAALIAERTAFLEELLSQTQSRNLLSYLGTLRYTQENPQKLEFIPAGRQQPIPFCQTTEPSCKKALRVLDGHKDKDVFISLKARVDLRNGILADRLRIERADPAMAATANSHAVADDRLEQHSTRQVNNSLDDNTMVWNGSD